MKTCPTCQRQYTDETLGFCLEDGTRLVEAFDSAATWVNPPRPGTDPDQARLTATPRNTDPTMVSYANPTPPTPSFQNPSFSPPPLQPAKQGRGAGIWIALGIGLVLLVIVGVAGIGLIYYFSESSSTSSSGSTPTNTPTPTPTPLASITGKWKGKFTNSKGGGGETTITINENSDGTFTGDEGSSFPILNGRRTGNTLTWEYKYNTLEYKNRMEINDAGTVGHGSYSAHDTADGENFTGTYVEYRKQ